MTRPLRGVGGALVVVVVLALSGCVAGTPAPTGSSSASPVGVVSPVPGAGDPSAVPGEPPVSGDAARAVAAAERLAAGYDYDAALRALTGVPGPDVDRARAAVTAARAGTVTWPDDATISHVFVHSLVVDPARAFDGDRRARGYLDYMVTVREFRRILDELHRRGFVLVNPADIAGIDRHGRMTYRPIRLPPGRTPIVLSQDDLAYYEYMDGDGFASRLVLGSDGTVENEYRDADGATHRGAYDVVPLVDAFVRRHPDFSYRGARGVIGVTGYNGVLGYRTSRREYPASTTMAGDVAAATAVARAMKAEGWVFASHSWGHIDMGTRPMAWLRNDARLWDAEVRPIVGRTDQFIFPFGADIAGPEAYRGERYALLRAEGFRFFYGIDGTATAWAQQGHGYQRQARIDLDGLRFAAERRGDHHVLRGLFDVDDVIDPARVRAERRAA